MVTENAGTKKWRAMSIRIGPRAFPVSLTGSVQPHVADAIQINAEYVAAGAGKQSDRPLCMAGLINGEPCRHLARLNRTSCGRRHD